MRKPRTIYLVLVVIACIYRMHAMVRKPSGQSGNSGCSGNKRSHAGTCNACPHNRSNKHPSIPRLRTWQIRTARTNSGMHACWSSRCGTATGSKGKTLKRSFHRSGISAGDLPVRFPVRKSLIMTCGEILFPTMGQRESPGF